MTASLCQTSLRWLDSQEKRKRSNSRFQSRQSKCHSMCHFRHLTRCLSRLTAISRGRWSSLPGFSPLLEPTSDHRYSISSLRFPCSASLNETTRLCYVLFKWLHIICVYLINILQFCLFRILIHNTKHLHDFQLKLITIILAN